MLHSENTCFLPLYHNRFRALLQLCELYYTSRTCSLRFSVSQKMCQFWRLKPRSSEKVQLFQRPLSMSQSENNILAWKVPLRGESSILQPFLTSVTSHTQFIGTEDKPKRANEKTTSELGFYSASPKEDFLARDGYGHLFIYRRNWWDQIRQWSIHGCCSMHQNIIEHTVHFEDLVWTENVKFWNILSKLSRRLTPLTGYTQTLKCSTACEESGPFAATRIMDLRTSEELL